LLFGFEPVIRERGYAEGGEAGIFAGAAVDLLID
jgi:hypothetical protein